MVSVHLIWMKFDVAMKKFEVNTLRLLIDKIYQKEEITFCWVRHGRLFTSCRAG